MSVLQGSVYKLIVNSLSSNYRYVACQRLPITTVQSFSSKVSLEEKLGIKPKPKKPLTLFLRFKAKIQPNLAKSHPSADHKELTKLAAQEWKKANNEVKTELQDEYKAEWLKYVEACKEYDKNLSPGDKEEIANAKKAAKLVKEKRALRKKREELGKPKKPPSPYFMYALSKGSERGNLSYKEWQVQVSKMWASLSEEEKDKFQAIYKQDLEVYKKKLSEWESRMMKEGKTNVVRS